MNSINLKIGPRFVKQDKDGFRPFQMQTLQAIGNPSVKIIKVEASVGAGKSRIIREFINSSICEETPVVLTFTVNCI